MSFDDNRTDGPRLLVEDRGELLPEAEKVERNDPVLRQVIKLCEEELGAEELRIPRPTAVVDRVLGTLRNSDVSTREVIRHIRLDPVLSGRLVELANSAAYAGSHPTFSLEMAVVRLGLNRICEAADALADQGPEDAENGRSTIFSCQWMSAVATALACEALAKSVPSIEEGAGYLTGLFHEAGDPLVVRCIGRLERSDALEPQSAGRVLGIVEKLSQRITGRVVRRWSTARLAQDAIRLRTHKLRDRRGRPLAHLLACGRALVDELGVGREPTPIDLTECRDFKFLQLDDERKLDTVRQELRTAMKDAS